MKETRFVRDTVDFSKNLPSGFVKKMVVFDTVDSTNSTAKDLAVADAEEGTVVIACRQKHGRGRFDRVWQSPEGGMYLSLILRPRVPVEKLSLLPLVAGLAVAKTVESFRVQTTMKWPNDVLANGKKIAGILLESEAEGGSIRYVVVGIGMNLNVDVKVLSADIQPRSTSLSHEVGAHVDYYAVLRAFFMYFEQEYSFLVDHQYERIIDEWKALSDTIGKTIRVQTSSGIVQGEAVDIDQSGFLLVRTEKGKLEKLTSGDCLY